jgi:DNA-binding transcriptional regulator YdaS (Cro superfamily)
MKDPALTYAIEAAGGVAALARALNIASQAVSQWDKCPVERTLQVSQACGWAVTPKDLRPDIAKIFAMSPPRRMKRA